MFTFVAEIRDAPPLAASQNGRHRTCGIHEIPQTANSDSNNIKYHTNSKNFLVYETLFTIYVSAPVKHSMVHGGVFTENCDGCNKHQCLGH